MGKTLDEMSAYIKEVAASFVLDVAVDAGELVVHSAPEKILSLVKFLRDDPACLFKVIVDVCGVDYPEREKRFDVVYHLLSLKFNKRVRVKVAADSAVPSIVSLFAGADWFEREAWDMYGIRFDGHPDLRRILTDYGFEGHPLRKDFPLTGFVELRYDPEQKRVAYEPVVLTQEFRSFDFGGAWDGPDYVLPGDEKAKGNAA